MAIEMGLHRQETLEKNFPDACMRDKAIEIFWCIYVLDRRWSFGTGMPFVLHDQDIDPSLPVVSSSTPEYYETQYSGKLLNFETH